jgi:membrane protein YqaA with SNARE-associated domain
MVSLWFPKPATGAATRAQRSHTFHWLAHLGLPGVFAVAVIDSSPIPTPIPGATDLLLLWLTSHKGDPWLLAPCAIAGAIVGGYLGWHLGQKGGEAALQRRIPARLLDPVHRWATGNPFLAVFLPALLPPPVPLSPFVLAAGALGIPRKRFLIAFGSARTLRYSLVAWLGATYGRHVIRLWSSTLDKWSIPLLSIFGGLLAAGILFAIWKARHHPKADPAKHPIRESAAD